MPKNQNNQPRSLLSPVGIASPLTGTPNWTMAVFEKDLVPEGTELFVQPSEGRLKLEVEVSNENAIKWQSALKEQVARSTRLRCDLDKARVLLRRAASFNLTPELQRDIDALLRE